MKKDWTDLPPSFPNSILSRLVPDVKKKGVIIITKNGKKMGRPLKSAEPKSVSLHLRITPNDAERIQNCSDRLQLNRTDTIMKGIETLEKELGKK